MSGFAGARAVVQSGIDARAFPAAVVEAGRAGGPIWREAFGRLNYDATAQPARLDTVFDLASLTKVIATASLVMGHVEAGRVALETRVGALLPAWRGHGRDAVTIRHLLEHSSGLPAHEKLFQRGRGRGAFQQFICEAPLTAAPGAQSVYSDVGFMLLGFLVEDLGTAGLDAQLRRAVAAHLPEPLVYAPPAEWRPRIASTEADPWRGRVLRGEVHDENAAALGGIAGHAGLFGTAGAVGAFARTVLQTFVEPTWLGSPNLMRVFATPSAVPGSSRALGWDTMRPTSSCGRLMSESSIGHTGFTGTSLWIDHARDVYVVLLTNRVHPTRVNDALVALRPRVHDAVMEEIRA